MNREPLPDDRFQRAYDLVAAALCTLVVAATGVLAGVCLTAVSNLLIGG